MEIVDHVPSIGDIGGAVEAEESVLPHIHEIFKDIDHFRHLAENKDLVSVFLLLLQDLIELFQFGGVSYQTSEVDNLNIGQ